jgi:hypothetical protein
MKKSLLTERFQQLAGIKPLYEIEGLNENSMLWLKMVKAKFKEAKGWGLEISTIKEWADEYYIDSTAYKFGTKEFKDLMEWLKREYHSKDGRAGLRNFFGDEETREKLNSRGPYT